MFEIILFLTFAVLSGVQPLLVKWFMPTTVKRNVIILCQELVKLIISLLVLLITSDYCIDIPDWTFKSAIVAAGVPSIMFVIQNHCNLFANQILQPVTFVVLNQTKIVWTAVWCFLLLKQSQSTIQIISLLLVIVATLYLRKILPLSKPKNTINNSERVLSLGVTLALFASFLSGLSGSMSQLTLQVNNRNPHLFNIELSIVSIVLLIISTMGTSIFGGSGGSGRWTWQVWIPIVTQAFSGILVGLVTKHLGAVTKSFGNIFGIAISSLLQQLLLTDRKSGQDGLSIEELVGACLCAVSLWLHVTNPI
ncbi:nucleotide-sugar transporter [Fragilariopsis cylindrus CCMP1102]|uniref:Nucleotide-sugar transporter n=1 Tax=Fragilariopsis cylindrus CCMP1102 TaxID=635003 RepID=A0A1E7FZC6_9STRA|nr:nucleotide-sugar transporter [Fragilariopsis cylindrus CCMP1102]|eukprot:OEU23511.1 nucleotide-sugar transporter [Fragilariopsis cylindrus CCMP1102]